MNCTYPLTFPTLGHFGLKPNPVLVGSISKNQFILTSGITLLGSSLLSCLVPYKGNLTSRPLYQSLGFSELSPSDNCLDMALVWPPSYSLLWNFTFRTCFGLLLHPGLANFEFLVYPSLFLAGSGLCFGVPGAIKRLSLQSPITLTDGCKIPAPLFPGFSSSAKEDVARHNQCFFCNT